MKIVIQRVKHAQVIVDTRVVGKINHGYMLLVGIETGDTLIDIKKAAGKIATLRLFEDEDGKMNRSILDVEGSILSVSQFTLAADVRKGNRPSFIHAEKPVQAQTLFETFNEALREEGIPVETGRFQTHMNVQIDNDGPVTIVMSVKDGKVD